MSFTIKKTFEFSAGHYLIGLPAEHPCSTQHGHNYSVTLEIKSPTLNAVGFVIDYRELSPFKHYIDTQLDHKNLNDFLPFNPTAENLAKHLFEVAQGMFSDVVAVVVCETPKTSAEYRQ